MTKKEKEKLIEAYNHFAKAIHEREYRTINVFGRGINGIVVTREDFEILKPFVLAHSLKVFKVGGAELKLSYGASFFAVEDKGDIVLCASNEEGLLEAYTDLYTMIRLANSSQLASKHFYKEGGDDSD